MIKIRSLEKQDIPSAEYICLITAAKEIKDTQSKALRTLLMYNRCYTRTQNSSSFVAENENGRVVGYILCAELAEISQRLFWHGATRDIQNKLYIGYRIIF